MPIKIASHLSAKAKLEEEEIVTIDSDRAATQDIRPLRILILNLMPLKKPTELQLLRLLGNFPPAAGSGLLPAGKPGGHPYGQFLPGKLLPGI